MANLNHQGQFWDRVTEQAQPIAEALRLIESLIPQTAIQGRDVLDAGCGAGDYSAAFIEAGAHRVTGFDVSMGSLRRAAERPTGRTADRKFMQASLSERLKGCLDQSAPIVVDAKEVRPIMGALHWTSQL